MQQNSFSTGPSAPGPNGGDTTFFRTSRPLERYARNEVGLFCVAFSLLADVCCWFAIHIAWWTKIFIAKNKLRIISTTHCHCTRLTSHHHYESKSLTLTILLIIFEFQENRISLLSAASCPSLPHVFLIHHFLDRASRKALSGLQRMQLTLSFATRDV